MAKEKTPPGTPEAEKMQRLIETQPQPQSVSQDISQLLEPYMKELTNLGPEYHAEMQYLQPYLSPEYGMATEQATAKAYGGAGVQGLANDPAQQALAKSEGALGAAAESMPAPGFGGLAQGAETYAESIPYQAALSSALGYQKYLETYQGKQPNIQMPPAWQQAYNVITGQGGTSGGQQNVGGPGGGLPSPTTIGKTQSGAPAPLIVPNTNPNPGG